MPELNERFADTFCKTVLIELFHQQEQQIEEDILQTITENNLLCETATPGVVVDGEVFDLVEGVNSWTERNELKNSLKQRFSSLRNQKEQLNDRKAICKGYLIKGINTADTIKDLYALFPTYIHPLFGEYIQFMAERSEKVTVTNNTVFWFQEKTKDDFNIVKQQVMNNLLNK